ncbi:hypothetical protein AVEN_1570-1 [Araneus ventricosus]|uniref:Helitron helicase-like domain-containing protein n=1 Tax=Araneus ventricosus TaxID=182803 RepID=A0A4Y2DQ33_ARAVE|nr:hypothetical protein AVEN_1570-1 [Araneus ventricosus]
MRQNYQDAMAMVRKVGRPYLFITFTCNPTWVDILNVLQGPQCPEDRPDIVLRLLFATACGFGEVNDIPELWFRYKDAVSEDFVRQYSEDSGPQYALAEIEEFLKNYNLNLKKT